MIYCLYNKRNLNNGVDSMSIDEINGFITKLIKNDDFNVMLKPKSK